jgi:hypothetical protein
MLLRLGFKAKEVEGLAMFGCRQAFRSLEFTKIHRKFQDQLVQEQQIKHLFDYTRTVEKKFTFSTLYTYDTVLWGCQAFHE